MAEFGTFTSGSVLTAAELNAAGAWTSFTPAWTNLVVGNGTVTAQYSKFNKILFGRVKFTAGSTSTFGGGGQFQMTLPASLSQDANQGLLGFVYILDAGTQVYMGAVAVQDATTVYLGLGGAALTYTNLTTCSNTRPMTWTTNDQLIFEFTTRLT